ncbi:hypothetical protein COF09_31860 [Bacillus toyonensis]|uniref:L,D-transpeptidase n=1 Tax=Bacillus toyonensis TaxID=155322 RepID=UPI000BFCFEF3|nr:L,D-transpeptidase [Bacillus toyonensis]PHC34561.1 hypothetical protein COF09_31860 [Bacillus toyonensis]
MKFICKFIVILIMVCSCIQPVKALTRTGHYIIIKQSEQKLYYVKGKRLLKSFSVAIRQVESPALTGRCTDVYKEENIAEEAPNNPLKTRWLGLIINETEGNTYGIYETNQVESREGKVSSGCIRMKNADVEWLNAHVVKGTPVIIW